MVGVSSQDEFLSSGAHFSVPDVTEGGNRDFLRGSATLVLGTALAQAAPIAVMPLYTRLYSPAAFGAWSVFTGIVAVLAVLGTARYDMAVLIPEDSFEAVRIVLATILLSLVVGLLQVALVLMALAVNEWHPINGLDSWMLLMLPLGATLLASFQVLVGWANRRGAFSRIALAQVLQQFGIAVVALSIAALTGRQWGLIAGTITGTAMAVVWLVLRTAPEVASMASSWTLDSLVNALRRHSKFPRLSMPLSLLTAAGVRVPVFLLAAFGFTAESGFVGLGRSLIFVPITLISTSVGRVFFKMAARSFGTDELRSFTLELFGIVARIGPPAFALSAVWGDTVFAVLFGNTWREAGIYSMILSPAAFAFVLTSWPERIYEIGGRQDLVLRIQVVSDLVTVLAVSGVLWNGAGPRAGIAVFAALNLMYSAWYLWGVFHVAQLPRRRYVEVLSVAFGGLLAWVGVSALIRHLIAPLPLAFALTLSLALGFFLYQFHLNGKGWMLTLRGHSR